MILTQEEFDKQNNSVEDAKEVIEWCRNKWDKAFVKNAKIFWNEDFKICLKALEVRIYDGENIIPDESEELSGFDLIDILSRACHIEENSIRVFCYDTPRCFALNTIKDKILQVTVKTDKGEMVYQKAKMDIEQIYMDFHDMYVLTFELIKEEENE